MSGTERRGRNGRLLPLHNAVGGNCLQRQDESYPSARILIGFLLNGGFTYQQTERLG
jgi:hypothetical protein